MASLQERTAEMIDWGRSDLARIRSSGWPLEHTVSILDGVDGLHIQNRLIENTADKKEKNVLLLLNLEKLTFEEEWSLFHSTHSISSLFRPSRLMSAQLCFPSIIFSSIASSLLFPLPMYFSLLHLKAINQSNGALTTNWREEFQPRLTLWRIFEHTWREVCYLSCCTGIWTPKIYFK